jgi:hypothetical protein
MEEVNLDEIHKKSLELKEKVSEEMKQNTGTSKCLDCKIVL